MTSEGIAEELVAVLLHNPPNPLPASTKSCLDETFVHSFLQVISSLQNSDQSSSQTHDKQLPHQVRILDTPEHPHVYAVTFKSPVPLSRLRQNPALLDFEMQHSLQLHIQSSHTYNTPKRLAVFDMDSTLIQQEVIDMLAAHAGVEAKVSDITARAMNGELDFGASLRERVALLKGVPGDVFELLKTQITLTPGAASLLRCLKRMNVKTALVSGGFIPLARYIGDKLGIDYIHANDLAVDPETNTLTGVLSPTHIPVVPARKKELLESAAAELGITDPAEIMAVGDGANDLPMMWAAGLGIAVNAKPKVQREAPGRLNGATALEDLLFLLGKTADEIEELAK